MGDSLNQVVSHLFSNSNFNITNKVMTKESVKETAANAQATVAKKKRRGVSNETHAVTSLKFSEKDAAQNGLFIGHLVEVRVDWSINNEGGNFTGLKVPRLTLHFASNHTNTTEQRHYYHTIFPVPSNVDTIVGGKEEWKVNNVLAWIKHVLDILYLRGRQLTEQEEDALTLPFEDSDEEGNYVAIDPEEVLAGYAAIFTATVQMLNGEFNLADGETAKPCYKTADGKPINLWMKLLRHTKRKGEWKNVGANGELAFDNFIGNGVIEIQKGNLPPTILRIDLSRESITPKEVNKAPSVGVPAMGGVMAGALMSPTGAVGAMGNAAYADAGGDMPF